MGQLLILLIAAVIAVPIFKRFGLGAVLGYLAAGIVIGPHGLRLISDVENMMHLSEIGVVLLLFLIGLELNPSRLWIMRRAVFGLGLLQVAGTTAVLAGIGILLGMPLNGAIVAGFGLALSSTAFVMPILAEKQQLQTQHGQTAFAILLFQDLAVIPMLAMMPLLAGKSMEASWVEGLRVVGAIAAVVVAGRYLVRPVFRAVAITARDSHEIFTATALLLVLGTAAAMQVVGLSMSLGAFLAGVLLAESEYRHELQADIEPFKGLLLGLFFTSVGMSANLKLVVAIPLQLVLVTLAFMLIKMVLLYVIGKLAGNSDESASSLASVLPQGGEFAFVLFSMAAKDRLLESTVADTLLVAVTASMIFTPLIFGLNQRFIAPRLKEEEKRQFDVVETEAPVIIAGLGRFGQIVARVLRMRKIPFTALEASVNQVDFMRKWGTKLYYGDASRLDLLRSAHADKAKVLVVAIDDPVASMRTIETAQTHFPHLKIYARARNRQHVYQLKGLNIEAITRETYASSLELSKHVLEGLGFSSDEAALSVTRFREHDERVLESQYLVRHDEKMLMQTAQQAGQELETLFEADAN